MSFRPDGKLRYANNSNYKGDNMIRKEVFVNEGMLEQVSPDKPDLLINLNLNQRSSSLLINLNLNQTNYTSSAVLFCAQGGVRPEPFSHHAFLALARD